MNYTTVENVEASLGRSLNSEEKIQVEWWIKGAQILIHSRLGKLEKLDSETLEYVLTEAVARKARNPDGKRNERIDDYSYGLEEDASKVDISLTETEWAMLSPKIHKTGAFSIRSRATGYSTGFGEVL